MGIKESEGGIKKGGRKNGMNGSLAREAHTNTGTMHDGSESLDA